MLQRISKRIDIFNDWIGRGIVWTAALMVFVTVYDVLMRYIFHAGSVALQELEWHLFSINFLVAAGWTLKEEGHVRVDIFYSRFGPRGRAWINLWGSILMCIPFCIVLIYCSWPFIYNAWVFKEGSPDPGGLPARYILKSMIPFGFGLLALQGVSEAIKNLFLLWSRE